MRAIDLIGCFAANVRAVGFRLSGAQVVLCLARAGVAYHRDVVAWTGVHESTVTNILKGLIGEGYVKRVGVQKPFSYELTEKGRGLAVRLLRVDAKDFWAGVCSNKKEK